MMLPVTLVSFLFSSAGLVSGAPTLDSLSLQRNGANAQKLNALFALLKKSDACEDADIACVEGSFAQCAAGKWQATDCASGTKCVALPLVNKVGTSVTCDVEADAVARIGSTGVSGGLTGSMSTPASSNMAPHTFQALGKHNETENCGPEETSSKSHNRTQTPGNDDGSGEIVKTVTVTDFVTATSKSSVSAASATLAPGFTLPPDDVSTTSNGALSTPTGDNEGAANSTTSTLSPALASALLSSLSAASPSITTSASFSVSSDAAAAAVGGSLGFVSVSSETAATPANAAVTPTTPLSLSHFTTTLAASNVGGGAPTPTADTGATGYNYLMRRLEERI